MGAGQGSHWRSLQMQGSEDQKELWENDVRSRLRGALISP